MCHELAFIANIHAVDLPNGWWIRAGSSFTHHWDPIKAVDIALNCCPSYLESKSCRLFPIIGTPFGSGDLLKVAPSSYCLLKRGPST